MNGRLSMRKRERKACMDDDDCYMHCTVVRTRLVQKEKKQIHGDA